MKIALAFSCLILTFGYVMMNLDKVLHWLAR
jgi:hypothetical protein